MPKQKVDPKTLDAVHQGIEAMVKEHGAAAVQRAWNKYHTIEKEREKLLKQKRDAEDALKKIEAKLKG